MYRLSEGLQRELMRFRPRNYVLAASMALTMAIATFGSVAAATGWVVVSSPNPSGSSFLSGVTCLTASNCWAVGGSAIGLIEHYDGHKWAINASPSNGRLSGIACVAANDCWAVGSDSNSQIEHYNGSAWKIASSSNRLLSVACANASTCWAFGYSFIAQYNGTTWSEAVNPLASVSLFGVSCLNLTYDCWAVGQQGAAPFIEHNTGTGWVAFSTPTIPYGQLGGVTCVATYNCWAVGVQYTSIGGTASALTEHYNGSGWSVVSTSHPNGISLNSVSCVGTTDCWAVGYRGSTPTTRHNLLEHHLATGWVLASDPAGTGTQSTLLSGVDCLTSTNCWAVGQRGTPTTYTLIEHFT
jgi:hypothetical protein